MDIGIHDVNAVLVRERRVSAFPCGDAAAAVSERDGCLLHPCGSEPVEEVCLAGYLAILEVCISKLAYVDLRASAVSDVGNERSRTVVPYLGNCRSRCNRSPHLHN